MTKKKDTATIPVVVDEKPIETIVPVIEEIQEETPEMKIGIIGAGSLSVVYPYLKAKAKGKELLYSMRSIAKNFEETVQIVVIGDREDWFADNVIHIQADVVSDNPQIDTLHKLMLAIADERVSDNFVWMNDDIYFASPVQLADIQVLTAYGKLTKKEGSRNVYDINRNETIELLKSMGLATNNYDTHTPFYYSKEKLVELFENVSELNSKGLLIPSIYFNSYFANHSPLQIDNINGNYLLRLVSSNPKKETFVQYIKDKKFLNNADNAYSVVLVEFLNQKFGAKCVFEK